MKSIINRTIVISVALSSVLWAGKSLEQYLMEQEPEQLTTKELKIKKIREEMGIGEVNSVRTDTTHSTLRNSTSSTKQNPNMSQRDIEIQQIKQEMGINEPSQKQKRLDAIRSELGITYDKPKRDGVYDNVKDTLDVSNDLEDAYDSVKDTLSFGTKKKKKKKSDDFSFGETLSDFYETVGLEEGENWGLPSVWGFNEKKKARTFLGSKTLGGTFLGDVKDSTSMFYSGMKNSGQSAEMMSGMMYNSSRMYNNMFGMFDSSPLNVFEDEKEASMFDFVEGGNSLMEMFN